MKPLSKGFLTFEFLTSFICTCSNLLADFCPGLFQPVDGAAVEGRGDLQHSVVVVEAATDVGHRQPLLYGAGPGADVRVGHYLRRHQVTHLWREDADGKTFILHLVRKWD